MSKETIKVGDTAEASMVVTFNDTAKALSLLFNDDFPEVFATARMISIMEVAAARVLLPLLDDGQLSVGVGINVQHTAPTPVGATVYAVATYLGNEGKFYKFRVEAFDEVGLIGEGEHTRAIINAERLENSAAKRRAKIAA